MVQPGTRTNGGVLGNPHVLSNLVCGFEANAMDILGERVRIATNTLDRIGSVGLVNPHCATGAHPVRMQEQHDFADDLLVGPCIGDLYPSSRANSLNRFQILRAILNHLKNVFPECLHQLFRVYRPYPFDYSTAEVFLDSLPSSWRNALEQSRFKLSTVLFVDDPIPLGGDPLTGGNSGH